MAVALTILALIQLALRPDPGLAAVILAVAIVTLLTALATPNALRGPMKVWLLIAGALNWALTRVLLSLAFWFGITPTALLMRLAGHDPLDRAWRTGAESYWEAPDPLETTPSGRFSHPGGRGRFRPVAAYLAFMEVWAFLRERRNYWLVPIVLTLIMLGLLIAFGGQSGIVATFIYAL